MTPRSLLLLAAVVVLSGRLSAEPLATPTGLKVVRVFTGWRDAASFKHISEYFTGREDTGHQTILRTHVDDRAGYYFLVRTNNAGGPVAARINLQLILPANTSVRHFTFPVNLGAGDTVLNLGLTGDDWPGARTNPVAWKMDLVAADGRVLASEKSYLWEKPADK